MLLRVIKDQMHDNMHGHEGMFIGSLSQVSDEVLLFSRGFIF